MAYRYTDVNTRAVYSPTQGTFGQAGKLARFWTDAAGTIPVDIGLYSALTPDTPGASTGSNQLVVQADGMWHLATKGIPVRTVGDVLRVKP